MTLATLTPDPEDIAVALDVTALKPCPFCGGWAHTGGYRNDSTQIFVFKVICTGCTATTLGNSREKAEARSLAMASWQRRAGPSAPAGWKLVPDEPTAAMMRAFWLAGPYPERPWRDGYKAILEGAPLLTASSDQPKQSVGQGSERIGDRTAHRPRGDHD